MFMPYTKRKKKMDYNILYVTFSKGAKVNIDGSDDMFYRYKMLQLEIKHIGKGKMLKTVFQNIGKVAETLHTRPEFIVAFTGYELSANFSDKSDELSVSGHLNIQILSKIVEKFIKTFIMCQKCKLPELEFDLVKLTCHSCGRCYPPNIKGSKIEKYISKLKAKLGNEKKKGIKECGTNSMGIADTLFENDVKYLKVDEGIQWITDTSDIAVDERKNELCNTSADKLLNN